MNGTSPEAFNNEHQNNAEAAEARKAQIEAEIDAAERDIAEKKAELQRLAEEVSLDDVERLN